MIFAENPRGVSAAVGEKLKLVPSVLPGFFFVIIIKQDTGCCTDSEL